MNTEYVNSKKKIKIFKSLFRQGKKITSLMKKDSPRKKEARVGYSLLQTSLAWTVSENQ